jgi:alkanesulfonate monooxygenase SsuD/methylene tetrahydromethanopterin reductase-like flavin-dependent oxidoreductase (luciferase family)
MKFGFVLPYGDAATCADLAKVAEESGWHGFFVWEPVWGIDAWVCLGAAAMTTSTIRLGTMLTPVSRCRPWKLASETATVDNLSKGRVVLSVGLGAVDTGFEDFGEETERKTRAELLDEGLDIITGLWKGQPFAYKGEHYQVKPCNFLPPPPPVQQPRIPIWVVGAWKRPKSLERVLKYDGFIPYHPKMTPEMLCEIREWVEERRTEPMDYVFENHQGPEAFQDLEKWREAGVTWWLESMWMAQQEPNLTELVRARLQQGPPV